MSSGGKAVLETSQHRILGPSGNTGWDSRLASSPVSGSGSSG